MATFHPFPRLPWGIRSKIWTYAVRPTDPGVHYFSVWTTQDLLKLEGSAEYAHECEEKEGFSNVSLSAPRCLPPDTDFSIPRGSDQTSEDDETGDFTLPGQVNVPPPGWFRNNPSTYFDDLALWMVCAESRRVMERIFSTNEGLPDGVRYDATMEFPGPSPEDGSGWFAVATHDLFVLQPVNCHNIRNGMRWKDGPYTHVAFEYDPQWDAAPFHASAVTEICCLVAWMTEVDSFWIIDYSLKRKEGVPGSCIEGKQVFYGVDRRFVHVEEDDGEHWEDGEEFDGSIWRTAFDKNHSARTLNFVAGGLEKEVADMNAFYQANSMPNPLAGRDIRFRVLACEFL
ncbi:hypothetical protein OQA88_10258 [Cercophora sp. LCS_1]